MNKFRPYRDPDRADGGLARRRARRRAVASVERVGACIDHAGARFEMRRALGTQNAESVLAAQLFMIGRAQGRVDELLPPVLEAVEARGLARGDAADPARGKRREPAGAELAKSSTSCRASRQTSSGSLRCRCSPTRGRAARSRPRRSGFTASSALTPPDGSRSATPRATDRWRARSDGWPALAATAAGLRASRLRAEPLRGGGAPAFEARAH